jgi:hypothetical protein
VIRGRWKASGFWVYWRVPHVRKYHIEFEMDLRQFLVGFCYYRVGFALCCADRSNFRSSAAATAAREG